MPGVVTAPPEAPPAGERIAGGWVVLGRIDTPAPFPVLRLEGRDGTPAAGFMLPEDAPEPVLDEDWAAFWNVSRCVLRDPRWGRLLVDELPAGPGILEEDGLATPAAVEELARRVHEAHRCGVPHGLLVPELVVRGPEGVAVAGWGLLREPPDEAIARDRAALAALEGTTGRIPPGEGEGADAGDILRPAVLSGHLPTLVSAMERARAAGVSPDDPLWRRAVDARARLEARVAGHLAAARERLDRGDPLGAVAACREAIRLGAEDDAGPILAEARRQARRLVGKPRAVRRLVVVGAVVAVVLAAGIVLLALFHRGDGETAELLRRADAVAAREGARAATTLLLEAWRDRGADPDLEEPIETWLARTAREERERLLALRREVVRRGGRPRRADRLADRALAELDRVAAAGIAQPNPDLRLDRALRQVDRAASHYRASSVLSAAQAAAAVDRLLALDPVFRGRGEETP